MFAGDGLTRNDHGLHAHDEEDMERAELVHIHLHASTDGEEELGREDGGEDEAGSDHDARCLYLQATKSREPSILRLDDLLGVLDHKCKLEANGQAAQEATDGEESDAIPASDNLGDGFDL